MRKRGSEVTASLSVFSAPSDSSCTSTDDAPVRPNALRAVLASVHSSDSWASPPESNTPTTVQVEPRKCSWLPTATPSNCCVACFPAINSLSPDWNMRPSTSFTSGRMAKPAGSTPRSATLTLACLLATSLRSSVMTMISPDTSGWPSAPFLMPGSDCTSGSVSGPMPEDSSASTPADSSSARSSLPVPASVRSKPRLIDSMPISTPTTKAMPTTITSEVPMRLPMLRRFIAVMARIVSMSAPRQCVNDRQAPGAPRRPRTDRHRQHDHGRAGEQPDLQVRVDRREGDPGNLGERGHDAHRQQHAADPSEHDQEQRLGQHQAEHLAVGKPDRLHHRQLGDPVLHRLQHGVAGQHQDREEHGDHDRVEDELEVAELAHEVQREVLLGLRLGLVLRVLGHRVDGVADLAGVIRVGDAHHDDAGAAVAELARLVEVGVVDVHVADAGAGIGDLAAEDADAGEFPGPAAVLL